MKVLERIASTAAKVSSEKGASMLEYALLAALIFVAAIGAVTFLGEENATNFSEVASSIGE